MRSARFGLTVFLLFAGQQLACGDGLKLVSIRPEKILYAPKEKAKLTVTLQNNADTGSEAVLAVELVSEDAVAAEQRTRDCLAMLALLWVDQHEPRCARAAADVEWLQRLGAHRRVFFEGIEPEGSYDEWPTVG